MKSALQFTPSKLANANCAISKCNRRQWQRKAYWSFRNIRNIRNILKKIFHTFRAVDKKNVNDNMYSCLLRSSGSFFMPKRLNFIYVFQVKTQLFNRNLCEIKDNNVFCFLQREWGSTGSTYLRIMYLLKMKPVTVKMTL